MSLYGLAHSSSTYAHTCSVSTSSDAVCPVVNHMDVRIFALMELTIRLSPYLVSSLSFVEGIIFLQSSRNTVKVET